MSDAVPLEKVAETVRRAVNDVPVLDIHTHLYSPPFGKLLLWGIDELITYHYLIAELFRAKRDLGHDEFWALSKTEQADLVWETLFLANSPVSESCRGVLTTLKKLGIDTGKRDLGAAREYFNSLHVEDYVDRVFELANVSAVVMTNNPLDAEEREVWMKGPALDDRFMAALRIDGILNDWPGACKQLAGLGFNVTEELTKECRDEIKRFLLEWTDKMRPVYMAASLPPDFDYPEDSARGIIMEDCVLAVARKCKLPVALMIGVKKLINPGLQLAGDGVGKADICVLERLALKNLDVRFLITMLSRENQHELCVTCRKFGNMIPFGCWWFLNDPSIILEMTKERVELLGLSFAPQHSDARILDQLIYKWAHSRDLIGGVLAQKYEEMALSGWLPTVSEIERDVKKLFGGVLVKGG